MPLNYNKWDKLELSDDSDIEEHPNIDKRSMINWKKRDILEKRQARKQRISHSHAEIDLNKVLQPRLSKLRESLTSKSVFSKEVERLKVNPSADKPPTGHEKQPTYDEMILDLLLRVYASAKEEVSKKSFSSTDKEEEEWVSLLKAELKKHEQELGERNVELQKTVEKEEKEMGGKITSEDIREGFSSGHINKALPSPWEEEEKRKASKPKASTSTSKETTIEVLNPSSSTIPPTNPTPTPDPDDQEDEDEAPSLTTSTRSFSKIPVKAYDQSFQFIQKDPSVLMERNTDALLAEAFELELKGDREGAKRCVHQGLMIQYCRKLGKDGVRLFFQRMQQAGPKAEAVFQNDVNDTYNRMATRCTQIKKEQAAAPERETIQLVAEDSTTQIGFNIPDGPPPENLIIEGLEEGQEVDMDEIKAFLQTKWDYWQSFPDNLKAAMQSEKLDAVNKVLENMDLETAEEVVRKMQEGGMLSFSESGVRDMTGQE